MMLKVKQGRKFFKCKKKMMEQDENTRTEKKHATFPRCPKDQPTNSCTVIGTCQEMIGWGLK
jgi:hypothetical protein